MTTIERDRDILTLINVFTVKPEDQQTLVELLSEATVRVMEGLDGFISANIHASTDGTRVVNYAQWRDEAAFQAMLADPHAQQHMQGTLRLAQSEPHFYRVAFVETAHP